MEQRADGNVRIRTNVYQEGWTPIEALKDIRQNTAPSFFLNAPELLWAFCSWAVKDLR